MHPLDTGNCSDHVWYWNLLTFDSNMQWSVFMNEWNQFMNALHWTSWTQMNAIKCRLWRLHFTLTGSFTDWLLQPSQHFQNPPNTAETYNGSNIVSMKRHCRQGAALHHPLHEVQHSWLCAATMGSQQLFCDEGAAKLQVQCLGHDLY